MGRQQDGHTRAAVVAVDEDEARVRFDRAVYDAQPETAPAGLRGEKRVEQAVANLDRNTGAVVRHAERDAAAVERDTSRHLVHRERRELHADAAALRRRLDGIQREVEYGPVKQVLIAFDD